jgi:transcriptional regulator with XRE-family HTH domain
LVSHSDYQWLGQSVGAKLKAARLARKLTQSQLAQPDFSVSYVSAIERGQIRPSLRALEIFAQRLGISSTDLLSKHTGPVLHVFTDSHAATKQDAELQLLDAHLRILQEDYHQAVTLLRALPADTLKAQQDIQRSYLLGMALFHAGLLQESEVVLTEAMNKATHQNDYFVKYIQNVLGQVHVSMHNHTQGFEYQLGNVEQLGKETQPHDAFFDAQVYANIGWHYVYVDKIDAAIEMFQHALDQTRDFLEPESRTSMYWNMSRYLADAQQYFLATLYGHKTLQLLLQRYHASLRSELYYYLGQAMLHQDMQKTLIDLERLLQDISLKEDALTFAILSATTAEALLRSGKVKKAYEYAQKACKLVSGYEDCVAIASISLTCGNIAYAQKEYQEGDTYFIAGLKMLERLRNREELADKYAIYAQLLEERGLQKEALTYYKQAYESSLEKSN